MTRTPSLGTPPMSYASSLARDHLIESQCNGEVFLAQAEPGRERQAGGDRPVTPQHSVRPDEQLADASRAQRLTADQRANAADRKEVRRGYGPAAAEKQRHDTEALAAGIDGERPEVKPSASASATSDGNRSSRRTG